jgi:formimidoylglutamase
MPPAPDPEALERILRPGLWPADIAPDRFASTISRDPADSSCAVALLGLPDDLGVRLNRGRHGAAHGPTAFRAALARYGVADPAGFRWPRVLDAGDVIPAPGHDADALDATHARVTEAARTLHARGLLVIGIGGGHDLTFPFARAAIDHHAKGDGNRFAAVNIDPHLDVRDTPGSGMPFRALVERCGVGALLNAGHNPLVNSREHTAWFFAHHGVIADDDWHLLLDEESEDDAGNAVPELLAPLHAVEHLAVSIDLDALDAAHAPGVSALNPAGLAPATLARAAFRLAADARVRCLDIMELCPTHDDPAWDQRRPDNAPGRTARVAAHVFLHALMGWRWGRVLRGQA